MINAITVDVSTKGESRIVLLLVTLVINVRKTTSELYADPVRDPNKNQGKCAHRCSVHEICRDECHDDDKSVMGSLINQIQSLVYM